MGDKLQKMGCIPSKNTASVYAMNVRVSVSEVRQCLNTRWQNCQQQMRETQEIIMALANSERHHTRQLSFWDIYGAWKKGTSFRECNSYLTKYHSLWVAALEAEATMNKLPK